MFTIDADHDTIWLFPNSYLSQYGYFDYFSSWDNTNFVVSNTLGPFQYNLKMS